MSLAPSDNAQSPTPVVAPLPLREGDRTRHKPPVWPIQAAVPQVEIPSSAKCARHSRADGVCCKELIKEERTLIDPDIVRDVVIGLSDGLTVPFALAAGLSSLGTSKIVVLGGVAELIAGAISMGIGGFLGSQAERDHYRYQRYILSQRVQNSCYGELEREVSEILGPVGVDEHMCRAVANCLRNVELRDEGTSSYGRVAGNDAENSNLKWNDTVGLTAFLLKFGHGLEEVPNSRMYMSAFNIGMGYLIGGIIPLIPYFFIPQAHIALIYSSVITGFILLIFGSVKARVTGAARKPADYLWGAVSMLMVGGLAAAAAFGIVRALESL